MVPDWECSSTSIFFRAAPRSRLISSENAAPGAGTRPAAGSGRSCGSTGSACGHVDATECVVDQLAVASLKSDRKECDDVVAFHMNWPGKSPLMIAFYPSPDMQLRRHAHRTFSW